MWHAAAHMIECEQAAWSLDYFVFYLVISGKYLLYEFKTVMLLLLSEEVA